MRCGMCCENAVIIDCDMFSIVNLRVIQMLLLTANSNNGQTI